MRVRTFYSHNFVELPLHYSVEAYLNRIAGFAALNCRTCSHREVIAGNHGNSGMAIL